MHKCCDGVSRALAITIIISIVTADTDLPLHKALKARKADEDLLQLINLEACQAKDPNGMTPLHIAAAWKASEDVIAKLIEVWPDALKVHDSVLGVLPLHLAARDSASDAAVLQMLKAYPAAASEQDADGNLPLHRALVQKASERTILRLLKANPAAVSHPNHALDLPLHMAAENKPSDVVINRLVNGFPEGLKTQSGSGHVPSALAHDERVKTALERAKAGLPKDEV